MLVIKPRVSPKLLPGNKKGIQMPIHNKFVASIPRLMYILAPWIATNVAGKDVTPETYAAVSEDDKIFLVQTLQYNFILEHHPMSIPMINMFVNANFITNAQGDKFKRYLNNESTGHYAPAAPYFRDQRHSQ